MPRVSGIDHSIYFKQQTPDIMGGIQRGMAMSDMIKQRRQKEAMLDIAKSNTITDEQGNTSLDQKGYLSDMLKVNPQMAMKLQNQNIARQALAEEKKFNKSYQMGMLGLKEQQAMLQQRKAGFIPQYGAKGQVTGMVKDPESMAHFSVGQKKTDTEFAKTYEDWTSGGSKVASIEIEKLKSVAERLKDGTVTTGGATGMFSDRITSPEVLSARADVQSSVMESLKALLGAAFTEKEGEKVIKNTWNESDTTENNLGRVNRLVNKLEAQRVTKDAKTKYFGENKSSLKGYDPSIGNAPKTQFKTVDGVKYRKVEGGWQRIK